MEVNVDYVIIVIPASLAVIVAVLLALFKRPAKALEERRQRMLELAGKLSLRYYGAVDAVASSLLPSSSLSEKDVPRRVDNLIAENRNPPAGASIRLWAGTRPCPRSRPAKRV